MIERTTIVLQAALLLRNGDVAVAEVFYESGLGGGQQFGTLRPGRRLEPIVERHRPT